MLIVVNQGKKTILWTYYLCTYLITDLCIKKRHITLCYIKNLKNKTV